MGRENWCRTLSSDGLVNYNVLEAPTGANSRPHVNEFWCCHLAAIELRNSSQKGPMLFNIVLGL